MYAACARIEEEEGEDPAHLADMIDFIQNFADRCHHAMVTGGATIDRGAPKPRSSAPGYYIGQSSDS